jgi:hypothetical protein
MTVGQLKHALMAAGLAGLAITAACGDAVRQGTGAAFLVIDSLTGKSGGDDSSEFGNVLQSDVSTKGSVYEDPGSVKLRLVAKDVSTPLSTNNTVTINRYRVVFRRADGRNQQGVDVPYAFDGAFTVSVSDNGTTGGFTLVRAQAKLEAPLLTLRMEPVPLGGGIVISTIAEVTFFGRDQVGNDISATGSMSVNFADWADPK